MHCHEAVQPFESDAAYQLPEHDVDGRGFTGQEICVGAGAVGVVVAPSGTAHCHDVVHPFVSETARQVPEQSNAGRGARGHEGTLGTGSTIGAFGALARMLQFRSIMRAVRGPTVPHPVVAAEPDDTIEYVTCHFCTAPSVSAPKYPVCASLEIRPSLPRYRCSASTSSPRMPRARGRVNFGHEVVEGFADVVL